MIAPVRTLIAAAFAAWCAAPVSAAERSWFTVVGHPDQADVDTIQVDVASIQGNENERTAMIRVSRASLRISPWADVKFRSFEALVHFDCPSRMARYRAVTYWSQPIWQGEPLRSVTFGPQSDSLMRFRGVEPNPAERIVRAACESHGISSAQPRR
ncbi:MAG: hypothetical protein KA795_04840 [Burkholderiaceae bacterium]|nr:hypothetical protein [Burkholderiaceae bacterium]